MTECTKQQKCPRCDMIGTLAGGCYNFAKEKKKKKSKIFFKCINCRFVWGYDNRNPNKWKPLDYKDKDMQCFREQRKR